MCIKLFHFILEICTEQSIHNKNCDQDDRTYDPYDSTDQSCFRFLSSCLIDFWSHCKQMIAAIPVMIAIGVQQQLTKHTTEMIP